MTRGIQQEQEQEQQHHYHDETTRENTVPSQALKIEYILKSSVESTMTITTGRTTYIKPCQTLWIAGKCLVEMTHKGFGNFFCTHDCVLIVIDEVGRGRNE